MSFFAIGDEDTILGLRLAGIAGTVVRNQEETRATLEKTLEAPDVKIIIITETIADNIRKEINHHFDTKEMPLIVEVPDKNGPSAKRATIEALMKAAVGMSI